MKKNPPRPTTLRWGLALMVLTLTLAAAPRALAVDDAHWAKAQQVIDRGIAYLREHQKDDGSWTPEPGPAVTALVTTAMLDRPDISSSDPAVKKAIDYTLGFARSDGGIHSGILQNYNTAICLSALARVNNLPEAAAAVAKAQDYLVAMQWQGQPGPDDQPTDEDHPFYGGSGYGHHGRPDMSNTQMMLQGLHDSGYDCNAPAFQRAMTFISRCQGIDTNDMFGDKIVHDGGFIYATSIDQDHVGVPESAASPDQEDEAKQGKPVSGLRSYGSMTYAGFKSYLYAQLDRDDPRVVAARNWISKNYTLDRNPGLPDDRAQQGLYYYYLTMARALNAWGSSTVQTQDGSRDWANDLIDALAERQNDDGSWKNPADRWMEADPNLVTAYALLALENATR